jgi:transcription factor MYB, plant
VKNFWNSYIKKKLRQRGIDPATHKPLALVVEPPTTSSGRDASAAASSQSAVFIDAELILSSAGQHMPPPPPVTAAESYNDMYGRSISADGVGGGACSDGSLSLSGYNYNQAAADLGAEHLDPAVVLPSVSSSSTLNSMAGLSSAATTTTGEHCNNNSGSNGFESTPSCSATATDHHLPWLELGTTTSSFCTTAAGVVDQYGAALDELKWSDYVFEGYQQPGQWIYGDSELDSVQFDAHGGLSSWCLRIEPAQTASAPQINYAPVRADGSTLFKTTSTSACAPATYNS